MAIADQMMPQGPAAPAGPSSGQQPAGQQAPGSSPDAAPEADENFVKAVNFARKQLYQTGADEAIHKMVKSGSKSIDSLAMMAYDLAAKADQVTGGMVMDENLVALGMYILDEVLEVAEASGLEIDDAGIASAFKQMLIRFLQEQGIDTKNLEEAFNKMSAEDFRKIAAKVDESVSEDEAEPAEEEMSEEEMPEEPVEEEIPEEEMEQ